MVKIENILERIHLCEAHIVLNKYKPVKLWVMNKDKMMGALYKEVKSQTEKGASWIVCPYDTEKTNTGLVHEKTEVKFRSLNT